MHCTSCLVLLFYCMVHEFQTQTITKTDPLQKEFEDERLKFLTPDRKKVLEKLDDAASLLSKKGDPGSGFRALRPER